MCPFPIGLVAVGMNRVINIAATVDGPTPPRLSRHQPPPAARRTGPVTEMTGTCKGRREPLRSPTGSLRPAQEGPGRLLVAVAPEFVRADRPTITTGQVQGTVYRSAGG
ncbi:hypothetical protein Sxan_23050 [Streptomyces xanthophaeus]|uniref:Uncharacterized protein n=1 Tax=Streptomyces xanthophaeus TaxID=67385 RepID=A0A919GYD3_9ACTN|nr:hypothetical protein Sxan_23050 [Streptomyces xanthophaeus]